MLVCETGRPGYASSAATVSKQLNYNLTGRCLCRSDVEANLHAAGVKCRLITRGEGELSFAGPPIRMPSAGAFVANPSVNRTYLT